MYLGRYVHNPHPHPTSEIKHIYSRAAGGEGGSKLMAIRTPSARPSWERASGQFGNRAHHSPHDREITSSEGR